MTAIKCPDCDQPLKAVYYEGVPVNLCMQCKGMFLDKNKLTRIEQSREIDIPSTTPVAPRKTEVGRSCPACHTSMKKVKHGKLRETVIDVCEACSGIWLDKGELESIQADYEAVEKAIAKNRKKASAPVFACPKCGHQQEKGIQCIKCGIVFAKYQARSEQESEERAEKAAVVKQVGDIYADIKGYEFKQTPSYFEGLIGFELTNEYMISLIGTHYQWSAMEVRKGLASDLLRNLFSFLYPYQLEVYDHNKNKVFGFKEQLRQYYARTDVYGTDGKLIGYIQRRFSLFKRKASMHFANGINIAELSTTLTNPYTFKISKNNRKIGEITKKWSGYAKEYFTDADDFSIRFPVGAKTSQKIMLLGAAYMIDKTFFEEGAGGGKQGTLGQIFGIPLLDSTIVRIILVIAGLWLIFYLEGR